MEAGVAVVMVVAEAAAAGVVVEEAAAAVVEPLPPTQVILRFLHRAEDRANALSSV